MAKRVKITQKPHEILQDPLLNKGTAFTEEERDALGLHGYLPCRVSTAEEQIARNYQNFGKKRTPLGKYAFLTDLLNRNEILFYQFAQKYIEEVMPIIYTPTVGEASLQYSMIYKERRGLYLSYDKKDRIDEILASLPNQEIQVIVVTDGERILGLGDQGIGGMVIPIGKLALYTLFAGVHPAKTLPILLDVGTNNPELLKNEFYLGKKHPRITGDEYYSFVDKFIIAVKKRFPKVLLQWEDFGKANAKPLLERYRQKILSFNDDIQGTASTVLGALFGASYKAGTAFKDHRVAILGGGSAGVGIAECLHQALIKEGLSIEESYRRIYIIDLPGLLHENLPHLDDAQKPFAKKRSDFAGWHTAGEHISLLDVVKNAHPTILIGVCAQSGSFSEEIVKEMAKHVQSPIIFPLSNPTSKAEAFPQELLEWTNGKAVIASGSPFPPAHYQGKDYHISQCNNAYIYPGVGLGALAAEAAQITDGMFLAAAKTLASLAPNPKEKSSPLFPSVTEIKKVSLKIAKEVALTAVKEKVCAPLTPEQIESKIASIVWEPHYDLFA